MTGPMRQFLWEQYPEVREIFEEFNDITQEDDEAWSRLLNRCNVLRGRYPAKEAEEAILDMVGELERMSKKRKYG